jgi:hypothetical protein
MTDHRLVGFMMCAAIALAASGCGRHSEPPRNSGLAVEEPNGQSIVVTPRGRSSNEIPAASLHRLSNARTSPIQLDTLKVDFRREGDKVIATIYALTLPHGNPHRYEDSHKPLLGVHSARMGTSIQVDELVKLGYAPITYKVISAKVPSGSETVLVSKVPSLEIRVAEENRAMYKPALRNKSAKDIVAFAFVRDNGNVRMMDVAQSFDPKRPLIPAGATYDRECPRGTPSVLAAALFADGTHEGNSEIAATLFATQLGRETQERRADPLVRRIIADRGLDDAAKIGQIQSALSSLPVAPEAPTLRLMQDAFPDLPANTLKKELARGLEQGQRSLWSSLYEFEHQNAVYPPPKTHPPIERWWPMR